jgi:hypothetical protein
MLRKTYSPATRPPVARAVVTVSAAKADRPERMPMPYQSNAPWWQRGWEPSTWAGTSKAQRLAGR